MEYYYSSKLASCRWCCLALIAFAVAAAVVNAQNTPADYVNPHNTARFAVGVASTAWDSTVAAYAQNYANARQGDCLLVHSGGTYGENLFVGGSAATAATAVNAWVSEKPYYDHATNTCATGKVCTDYTQVVWNTSTAIGCGRVVCLSGSVFFVCNYNPKGNIAGQSPY